MPKPLKVLKFVWKHLHKEGAKFDHKAAQTIINNKMNKDVKQPHGAALTNAVTVEEFDTPHESRHIIDGKVYIDPVHSKFRIINENEKRITTAHYYYPDPLGDRHLWYSKDSLNGGVSSRVHWIYVGTIEEGGEYSGKEKGKAASGKGKAK